MGSATLIVSLFLCYLFYSLDLYICLSAFNLTLVHVALLKTPSVVCVCVCYESLQ